MTAALEVHWNGPRDCLVRLASAALGRPASLRVLLPAPAVPRPAPLLLLLHGSDARIEDWERGVGIARRAESLGAIVAIPECGAISFCANWLRAERPRPGVIGAPGAAPVAPAWERFHVGEVLPFLEARFGAGRPRVVLGISAGGRGALAYAARHPGSFAAAASFSGVLDTLGFGIPSLIAGALLRRRQHRHAIWGSPLTRRARWEADNPLDLAGRLAGTALYLARGDGRPHPDDPPTPALVGTLERLLGPCTDAMALRLADLGIPATVSVGMGVHEWPTWDRELDLAWPFLLNGLGLA